MKTPHFRGIDIFAGHDIYRAVSLLLYAALLFNVVLLVYDSHLSLSPLGVAAAALLIALLIASFVRYFWLHSVVLGEAFFLCEIVIATFIIAVLSSYNSMPWLIVIAGISPLVLRPRIALIVIAILAGIGYFLTHYFGAKISDLLPDFFATLCIGWLAVLLAKTLHLNRLTLKQAHTNERRFNAIARVTRHIFIITDSHYHIKFANPALQEVIGYDADEVIKHAMKPVLHADDEAEHQEKLRHLRDTPHSTIFSRHRTRHKDGHWIWLETRGYNMLHDAAINGLVFSIEDVTLQRDAEQKLQEETALLRAVLDLNPSMIYAKDSEGRFTISNQSFQKRFGYDSEEELRGKTAYELCLKMAAKDDELSARDIADEIHRQDLQVMRTDVPLQDIEVQGFWRHDMDRWFHTSKYPLPDVKGNTIGVLGVTRDITKRKNTELKIEYQAMHDILTDLPNRRFLVNTLTTAMEASRQRQSSLTMLFCDLDFFKSVNDTHGHDFGDQCLIETSKRIVAALPKSDFVARFGGNEFVILTNSSLAEATVKANAIMRAVSERLIFDNVAVKIQTSIGIAQLNVDHQSPADLIRDADAAMYQAKERGRNRAEIYDAALQSKSTKHARMDVALRFALEREELSVAYQPKISLTDGSVQGFELLLRWNSPEYGMVSPNEFIPIAETSGMVVPIGMWAMEQACSQLAAWQTQYPEMGDITIAVNVSMRQLLQTSFFTQVRDILESTGVVPHMVELELTETSAMANPLQTMENLSMLKKLGVRLALDDFGTGYSSLAYLQKLPIDILKIDKAFVRGLGTNQSDMEIIRLMMALAQTLNLQTTAEGVETFEQLHELKKMGCDLGQGFLFSMPLTAQEAEALICSSHRFPLMLV
ncbi:putative bifunctional diguanylate cyclase/phosphodiesterase [Herminiimonas arsenitoxidans]|uniref:putative bifunctional diguanylate cyclase/phosphodiesterase n=1 Tax=Herminiimonas arsenitoxidans TaxID=1809410 RepID=UPI0009711D7C|nr:bifunctional diguanylate cyclase/phosphodiesterase [Herminiimonas arsenitoxidans]